MTTRSLSRFEVVLVVAVIALAAVIAFGTIWAFAFGPANARRADPAAETIVAESGGKRAVFGGIGQLRAATADDDAVTVVVSPYFPYPAADAPFREELVSRTVEMRRLVLDWFRARRASDLADLGEDGVKAALLTEINRVLLLGRLEAVYFDEYHVIGEDLPGRR